ncbi:helix-turn-helix domain-containing protein [Phytohabitans rumicis]|uniref:PucR C-terminal helix-turn-helix domain-containing protein n=1 Tax=Phytohabitans rumicis TaxID=1076125 RepID=A0A6V8KYC4_9ACTN|nr:helix-turn-helix domain-containing protein [Phytohabitans rumicis]GFJ88390.1 hypothetical protein Prum_020320 [Phytohabitans rumicis]
MQGLLLRLAELDADAENAVRVIAYFDELVRHHADAVTVLRAAVVVARCPAGLRDPADGQHLRMATDGRRTRIEAPPPTAATRTLDESGLLVWLERDGAPQPLDAIILERFAVAAEVAVDRARGHAPAIDDPALVELVLAAGTGPAERGRALRLLGLRPDVPLRVLAAPGGAAERIVKDLVRAGRLARGAELGDAAAVLTTGAPLADVGDVGPLGVGPAVPPDAAGRSWAGARAALRLASGTVVVWDDLGPLALVAEHVPDSAIGDLEEVRRLEALAGTAPGREAIAALEALCAHGSLRRAAEAVHLHHSSMAARIARAQAALGYVVDAPAGRQRAYLALRLWSMWRARRP